MFDMRDIDSFFEGSSTISSAKKKRSAEYSLTRFIKLGFPCFAAALFGLMIVLPNIKKSADIRNDITMPRKSEIEKLHAEQVVMSVTDKKNRISTVWSDNMDEIEFGSNEIKINAPKAEIPSDSGMINIAADTGFVNQKNKILRLEGNVLVIDEKNNVISTSVATYEFNTEFGYGNEPVQATGDWGSLSAEGFTYDKNSEILTLPGTAVVKTQNGTLTSDEETKFFQSENKIVSTGNAVAKHDKHTLYADKIINYLSGGSKKELEKTEAFGNVKIVSEKGTARAKRALYNNKTQRAELFDNVVISTEKGVAKGSHAIYNQANNTIDLYGNVVLEQGENFMHGSHVHTDLNTSISTIVSDKKQGKRVSGTFYNKREAENGKKTK